VFLDIVMPGIDGYEVCKQLRKMPNYKRTPVIMLSGKTGPLDEVEGILAGASTYMLKPVKHKDFQQTLERISKWLAHFS
jgi:CheY-like chemotaxis protein